MPWPSLILLLLKNLFELGLVLDLASGAGFGVDDPRGFGLADALPGVGLYRLGCGEFSWLAFRHGGCLRSSLVRTSMEYVKPEWKPLRVFV